jgi:alanine racemase
MDVQGPAIQEPGASITLSYPPQVIFPPLATPLRTWVELKKTDFTHNIDVIQRALSHQQLAIVVKSNAYGHGASLIGSWAEEDPRITMFCTATVAEACTLRAQGVTKPILALYEFCPTALTKALEQHIDLAVYNQQIYQDIRAAAHATGKQARVHLKFDTGMTRLGLSLHDIPSLLTKRADINMLSIQGVYTHLADKESMDQKLTIDQLERFEQIITTFKTNGYELPYVHALSSDTLHLSNHYPFLTMARVGAHCYGLWYTELNKQRLQAQGIEGTLRPLLTWKTELISLKTVPQGIAVGYGKTFITQRPTVIGLLPLGYADGLPRALGNKAHVLIRSQQAPLIGTMSMNLTTVDVTDIVDVEKHDEVTLIGHGKGVTAYTMAEHAGTIPLEITTGIHQAIARISVP